MYIFLYLVLHIGLFFFSFFFLGESPHWLDMIIWLILYVPRNIHLSIILMGKLKQIALLWSLWSIHMSMQSTREHDQHHRGWEGPLYFFLTYYD